MLPRPGPEYIPCRIVHVTFRTTASFTTLFLDRARPPSPANRAWKQGGLSTRPPARTDPERIATRSFLPCHRRDGLDAARARIREHLGWLEVREQLKEPTRLT